MVSVHPSVLALGEQKEQKDTIVTGVKKAVANTDPNNRKRELHNHTDHFATFKCVNSFL